MDNIKIGKFIKTLRKNKKMTQKELAEKLNITDRAVSRWERGIGCPDISLLEEVANILGVTVLELLKGQYLEKEKTPENKDLLESMKFSHKNLINNALKVYNYLTILLILTICIFIIISNIKSIYLLNKNYDLKEYNITNESLNLIDEFNNKVDVILNNQGKYKERDYLRIKSSMKIMKERLEEQNNNKYLGKDKYNYIEIVKFYTDHNNLYTMEIDNIDLYKILIKYNATISDNMIKYELEDQSIKESMSNILFTLEEPYFISNNNLSIIGNIDSIVRKIYEREIRLCNDIIRIGELK